MIDNQLAQVPYQYNMPDELGCPVQNYKRPCPRCNGNWPGTKITHEAMLKALISRRLKPSTLGCNTLKEKAERWYAKYH